MKRTYTVFLNSKQIKITNEGLSLFADQIGISNAYRERVSELLILDLFIYVTQLGVSPQDILEELVNLENGDGNTQTKPATEFRRPLLAGLWHKHFFCHHFLVQNIQNALKGGKLHELINNVMDPSKATINKEMISELAHRVTNEPVENRANAKRLTGEWIIFAKNGGMNYYLCLNTHKTGDHEIANRIRDHCVREFSFLANIVGTPTA